MKSVFPTSYSTLSSSALASFISVQYGFENVQCRFIVRGVGDTYLLETGNDKYVLRIYRSSHRSLADVEAETNLLAKLKEAGVSVSYAISDRSGNLIQQFDAAEGPRYGVVFSFAEGSSVNQLSEIQLKNFGREMALFHNISSAIQLGHSPRVFDTNTTLFQPLALIKQAFTDDQAGYTWLMEAAQQVKQKIEQTNTSGFSTGYCQFDFLPKNFHFDNNDKITFFDFDFFGHGWLVNDIMTYWVHLTLDVFFNRMTQEAADKSLSIFVEAYREHRKISDAELALIPYLSLGFWLFYMGFHTTHDQFYPFIFQPAALRTRMNVIKQLMEKYWTDVKR